MVVGNIGNEGSYPIVGQRVYEKALQPSSIFCWEPKNPLKTKSSTFFLINKKWKNDKSECFQMKTEEQWKIKLCC